MLQGLPASGLVELGVESRQRAGDLMFRSVGNGAAALTLPFGSTPVSIRPRARASSVTPDTRGTMDEAAKLLERALAGHADSVRALVDRLTPIIQARVARALTRAGRGSGRDARQEMEDLVQDVFATLFKADGKALKAWKQRQAEEQEVDDPLDRPAR